MQKHSGFTLVELMVAMLVGLVLLTASGSFYLMNLRASMDSVKTQQFDKTVQVFVDNVASEVRRACYAMAGGDPLPLPTFEIDADGECMRLSHSIEGGDVRSYGFKFLNSKIYLYSGVAPIGCDAADDWEQLPGVSVQNASFSQGADCDPSYEDNTVCFEFDAEGDIPLSEGEEPKRRVESVSVIRNFSSCN